MSSIENIDSLLRRFDRLDSGMRKDIMLKAVKKGDLMVQSEAKLLAPYKGHNLRRSIKTKEEVIGTKIVGSVYTNLEYAPYVEFGTGPAGQENHQGISPGITPRYSQRGWMIPADAISEDDAQYYHFKPAMKNGQIIGYYTKGQPARPYLYPALKDHEKTIVKRMKIEIAKSVKELCKK